MPLPLLSSPLVFTSKACTLVPICIMDQLTHSYSAKDQQRSGAVQIRIGGRGVDWCFSIVPGPNKAKAPLRWIAATRMLVICCVTFFSYKKTLRSQKSRWSHSQRMCQHSDSKYKCITRPQQNTPLGHNLLKKNTLQDLPCPWKLLNVLLYWEKWIEVNLISTLYRAVTFGAIEYVWKTEE